MKKEKEPIEIDTSKLASLVHKKRTRMKAGYRKTAKAIGGGISHMAIKRLETENTHPRPDNLKAILSWLGLDKKQVEKVQETLF